MAKYRLFFARLRVMGEELLDRNYLNARFEEVRLFVSGASRLARGSEGSGLIRTAM